MRILSRVAACLVLLVAPALADDLPATKNGVLEPAAAAKLLPPGTDLVVKVLDTGSAPREELRYALARGTVALIEDLTIDSNLTAGQAPAQHGVVATERATTIRTTEASARGAHVEIEVTRVTVAGKDQAGGGTVDADVSPKGRLSSIRGLGPTGFQTSIVVLPDGPIGKGARWQVIRLSPGNAALHIETYTVRSRDPHVLELDVSTVQFLVTPTLPTPGGAVGTVQRYEYRGSGRLTIDTTALVPSSADATARTRYALTTSGHELTVDSTTTTRTSARPAP
jgi:hypothetical protein